MIILGIDPGTATTGYGLIRTEKDKEYKMIEFGWIATPKDQDPSLRLKSIYDQALKLFVKTKPDVIAIEKLFFYNNQKTAMRVSEAIGVIKLAVVVKKIPIFEYAPLTVKSVVTKNGRAKKPEVQKIIKKILRFRAPKNKKTHFDDAADALGIAICHAKMCSERG